MKTKKYIFAIIILVIIGICAGIYAYNMTKTSEEEMQKDTQESYMPTQSNIDPVAQKIDSIKSKEKVTKEDIDYVLSNTNDDRDFAWCTFMEIEMLYDSLELMRIKVGEDNQQIAQILDNDWKLFNEYQKSAYEAYIQVCEIDGIGSAVGRSLCSSDMSLRCCKQYETASRSVLACLCGEKTSDVKHKQISSKMLEDAYSLLIEVQEEEQKKNIIKEEQAKWNKWIDYRNSKTNSLPDDARKNFKNGTNNVMRSKLIQLKNQYEDIGIVGNDIINCYLPDDCTDDELIEYPGMKYVWDIYFQLPDDAEWNNWKSYRIYVGN